jgi:hypothetical protein
MSIKINRLKIYDKRDDFNFKIINFPNMCSNIPASPAYGVYISQLIRYARASSDNVKNTFTSHIEKKIFLTFLLKPYLYTFSLYENPSFNETGRFDALKSDSTHHFFRNACTKSGSLRFSPFSGCFSLGYVTVFIYFW